MNTPKVNADHEPAVKEIHVVWMTTGLSCDGDSVSVTAASLPSIEDVVMGAIPGLPKVHLHNPVLAYEVGDDFMKYWHMAAEGGSSHSCSCSKVRCRTRRSRAKATGRRWEPTPKPASRSRPTNGLIGSRPRRTAIICAGTCATFGGIHAMEGNPTGAMGLADYLGWNWRSKAGLPIVNVPGCPVQPDNMMETLLYLLYQVAGLGADDPAETRNCARPGCSAKRCMKAATAAPITSRAISPTNTALRNASSKIGCWGPVVNCNVTKRGWMDGIGGCPNVGGICIGCTMPGFPDKFMPFMDEPPGATFSSMMRRALWEADPLAARHHQSRRQQGASLAPRPAGTDDRLSPALLRQWEWRQRHSSGKPHLLSERRIMPAIAEAVTREPKSVPPSPNTYPQARAPRQHRGDVLGPHHPHCGEPRHLHED